MTNGSFAIFDYRVGGLNKVITESKIIISMTTIQIGIALKLTYLIFVDYVLLLGDRTKENEINLKDPTLEEPEFLP